MLSLIWQFISGRLLKAAGDAIEFIWRHPWQTALIASLALSGWLWLGKSNAIEQRDKARIEHAQLVEANRLAIEYATAAKRKAEQRNKELNDEADKRSDDLRVVYRDRILWRTAKGNPASTDMPGSEVPQSPDGPGEDSICISRSDALIFTENQARLQSAHDWALEMEK